MAKQLQPIDITNTPELLRIAREVRSSKRGRVLRSGDQDIAVLVPILPQTKARSALPRYVPAHPYPKLPLEQVAGSIPSISGHDNIDSMIEEAKAEHANHTMTKLNQA